MHMRISVFIIHYTLQRQEGFRGGNKKLKKKKTLMIASIIIAKIHIQYISLRPSIASNIHCKEKWQA